MAVRAREADAVSRSSIELGHKMRRARVIATVDPGGRAHRGQTFTTSDKMERRFFPGVKAGAPSIA